MRAQEHMPSVPLPLAAIPAAHEPPLAEPGGQVPLPGESLDISRMLAGWEFEAGQLSVRKIRGDDGRPRLQIRLDLGLLQMELTGRPDGRRPNDFVSLYDYHLDRLNEHRTRFGTELGYFLSPNDCRELRDEASMYYHRYLGLFVLGDYSGAARDTKRNLDVVEFCRRHAAEDRDRVAMEAYRPYLLMMHARARAGLSLEDDDPRAALKVIRWALREIRDHFRRFGGRRAHEASGEVRVLRKLASHLERSVPQSPVRRLKRALERAVAREDYERAARLRDQLARLRQ